MVAAISVDVYSILFYLLISDKPRNRSYLVALDCLIVRRRNLEVATKRLLHQQVKYQGSFSAIEQLFPVVSIFQRSLGVICYDR